MTRLIVSYSMNHNHRKNPLPRNRRPTERVAYLLGMGPIPPPTTQEMAVAALNRLLDEVDDVNPQPHNHPRIVPAVVNSMFFKLFLAFIPFYYFITCPDAQRITVRVPVSKQVVRDIVFSSDIPRGDFFDRILAAMGLDTNTAQLGWKTNDDPKRSAAHRLADEWDVNNAFKILINMMNNPRRWKEVVMIIIHLVSN